MEICDSMRATYSEVYYYDRTEKVTSDLKHFAFGTNINVICI